jgi:hypothetical protein
VAKRINGFLGNFPWVGFVLFSGGQGAITLKLTQIRSVGYPYNAVGSVVTG